jgi:hypothetical protein
VLSIRGMEARTSPRILNTRDRRRRRFAFASWAVAYAAAILVVGATVVSAIQ